MQTSVTTGASPASVSSVTLSADLSNATTFVNSMFTTERSASVVFNNQSTPIAWPVEIGGKQTSISVYLGSFANEASVTSMIDNLYNAWTRGTRGYLQPSDFNLITQIATYVGTNCPVMWVPQITFERSSTIGGSDEDTPPVYQLQGYQMVPLKTEAGWNEAAVKLFLSLFLCGAHVVPMQQPLYGPAPTFGDFMQALQGNSNLSFRQANDSHYTNTISLFGFNIPVPHNSGNCYQTSPPITSDSVPANCPLICSFLMGPTVQSGTDRECFFQLEGWPDFGSVSKSLEEVIEAIVRVLLLLPPNQQWTAVKQLLADISKKSWHMADYASYTETLWNFSTYGVCAYSEKRATSIFLSSAQWVAKPAPSSIMAPYAGANPVQKWLQRSLVSVSGYSQPNPVGTVVAPPSQSSDSTAFQFDPSISQVPQSGTLSVAVTDNPNAAQITFNLDIGSNTYTALGDGSTVPVSAMSAGTSYKVGYASNAGGQAFVATFFHPAAASNES
jgi:hypothetical protein